MDRVDEKRLLKAAQRGDASAFSDLYRANVQAVFRYIYYRVSDKPLAEDLTGDVFVKALQGLPKYVDQGKPFVAWLYRIAHARVVDFYRKSGRQPVDSLGERENIPAGQDMDAKVAEQQARQQTAVVLRKAIATLTTEQQQVIILRFVEEKHLEEVAQLLGKNANAIKALQHRALRTLAGKLQRAGFPVEEILAGLSS